MTTCRQKDDESVETLQDKLMSAVQNFKLMGGDLTPEGLIDKELQENGSLSNKEAATLVENKLIGIMMIEAANDKKFDEYRRSLQNSMSEGHNRYPTGKAAAYTMLSKYQPNKKKSESVVNTSNVQRSGSSTRT
jgi:hypothetical protein